MLIDLLLTIILGVVGTIINLIPDLSFSPDFMAGFDDVAYLMGLFSKVVPMNVLFACLSVFFLLNNMTLIISIINWVIRKIPGIS